MRDLTDKQREVLGFMRSFVAKHGVPPTVREIGDRFKVTPRAAFDHLRALERKGALQRRVSAGRTSRALTLTDPPARATYAVPILGRVAAGQPLLASENREGEAPVKRFSREGERVVLKPEHPTMTPIVVDPRRTPVKILGKVVGVLRGF